jgi:hypothetical protein
MYIALQYSTTDLDTYMHTQPSISIVISKGESNLHICLFRYGASASRPRLRRPRFFNSFQHHRLLHNRPR